MYTNLQKQSKNTTPTSCFTGNWKKQPITSLLLRVVTYFICHSHTNVPTNSLFD